MPVDAETVEALKQIHTDLELDEEGPYDLEPEDWVAAQNTPPSMLDIDVLLEKFSVFTEKLSKKFRKSKATMPEVPSESDAAGPAGPRDEMEQELTDAWNLFTRGSEVIPSKHVGYVLRILGQNPTEDEIVAMVMKADCEWDGSMNRKDFLIVGQEILKNSCDQMDDVRAAFRVFDYDKNGSISKEELREAMVNLGQRCTEEEFALMFAEADKNKNGRIDFDEFVDMMLPSANTITRPETLED
jgi:Ca2+-binding EF-hand superfamily protein